MVSATISEIVLTDLSHFDLPRPFRGTVKALIVTEYVLVNNSLYSYAILLVSTAGRDNSRSDYLFENERSLVQTRRVSPFIVVGNTSN